MDNEFVPHTTAGNNVTQDYTSNMETGIFYVTTFIPTGGMYLHARTFFTLTVTISISMGVMYLHARMFCTFAHTSSIPMGAMYLYMQERFLDLLIRSYTHCRHQFLL